MNSRKPSAAKKQLILAIGILFIGMCLRAPFTSIGPLLEIVQKSLHLSTTAIGLVNALPLLAFATVSPMVPSVSRKLGLELALGMALVLVGGGVLLRSLGHIWSLYMGTALLGCGIAICNVLLPSLVKQDFPSLIPRLTVAYALSMGISAALGSALVVPLAQSLGWGWELASGSLVLLPLAASAAWLPQLAVRNKNFCKLQMEEPHKVSLWKSALAWQVTLFFGLTSLTYYISVSWLPALGLRTDSRPHTLTELGHRLKAVPAPEPLLTMKAKVKLPLYTPTAVCTVTLGCYLHRAFSSRALGRGYRCTYSRPRQPLLYLAGDRVCL